MSITFCPSPTAAPPRARRYHRASPADPPQPRCPTVAGELAAPVEHAATGAAPNCRPAEPFPVAVRATDRAPVLHAPRRAGLELLCVLGLAPWPTIDDAVTAAAAVTGGAAAWWSGAPDPHPRPDVETGRVGGADLRARITLVLGLAPEDPGQPTPPRRPSAGGAGARFIDCGHPLGHLHDLLAGLRVVAVFAEDHGRDVCWA